MTEDLHRYAPIALSDESTVVAEFIGEKVQEPAYQSEAELEKAFIQQLESQAYEYLPITSETDLRLARINYYNALYQVLSNKIDVQRALGQLNY